MPGNITPMALTLSQQPFNDKEWQFEIKWDGFRMVAYCNGEKVNLSSRRNNSLDKRFSSIKMELQRMKLNAVLDGEVVTLDDDGSPNFSNIITPDQKGYTVFYVFDILWFEGRNVLDLPLVQRRKILKWILGKISNSSIQ
jgi:bifunctional non-homologous end joining protein LigD